MIVGDGVEFVLVTAEQLREWIAERRPNRRTPVQVEGSGQWIPLGWLLEFAEAVSAAEKNWGKRLEQWWTRVWRVGDLMLNGEVSVCGSRSCLVMAGGFEAACWLDSGWCEFLCGLQLRLRCLARNSVQDVRGPRKQNRFSCSLGRHNQGLRAELCNATLAIAGPGQTSGRMRLPHCAAGFKASERILVTAVAGK